MKHHISSDSKVILVTGSSNGIGRLTVETLARQGHTVYASLRHANGRNAAVRDELQQLASHESLNLYVVELDVTDDVSVEAAVADIITDAGRVDVLVNNAGVMNIGITEGFTLEQVQRQFDVNFYGAVRTNRAVLPHMRRQGEGLLIQISSLAGRIVLPFFGIYNASKFAVEAMSEAYRYDLSGWGVDSVIVEPGPYGTNLLETIPWPEDKQRLEDYTELAGAPEKMIVSFSGAAAVRCQLLRCGPDEPRCFTTHAPTRRGPVDSDKLVGWPHCASVFRHIQRQQVRCRSNERGLSLRPVRVGCRLGYRRAGTLRYEFARNHSVAGGQTEARGLYGTGRCTRENDCQLR